MKLYIFYASPGYQDRIPLWSRETNFTPRRYIILGTEPISCELYTPE